MFNCKLEAWGDNSALKMKFLTNFIGIKESLNLSGIWRTRDPILKLYTIYQNH